MTRVRIAAAALALVLAAAGTGDAQPAATPIRVGQTLPGELARADSQTWGRGRMEIYRLQAQAGVRYQVTVRAQTDLLDAALTVSRQLQGVTDHLWRADDGGPGRNDPRLAFTATDAGPHLLIVSAGNGYDLGAFTITVDTLTTRRPGAEPVVVGRPVNGTLARGDSTADRHRVPGVLYDLYWFEARSGQRLRISASSPHYAVTVSVGRLGTDGTFSSRASSPRTGRLNYTVPEDRDGDYFVQVMADSGHSGDYTLRVDSRPLSSESIVTPIQRGQTLTGVLEDGDAMHGDGRFYDSYSYRGRAGERLRISLASAEFDTLILLGRMVDGVFEELESNNRADSTTIYRSALEIVLPRDGDYVIRAASLYDAGEYRLAIAP